MSSTCVVNGRSEKEDLLLLEKEENNENDRMNTTTTTATSMSMTSATKNDDDKDDNQQEIDCDQQENIEFVGFDDGENLVFDDADLGFDDKVSTDGNTNNTHEAEKENKKDKVKHVSVFLSNTTTSTAANTEKSKKQQQQQRPWFSGTTSHWKEIVTEKYRYSNSENTQTEVEEGQEEKEQKEQTKENDDEKNNKNNSNENHKTPTSAFPEFVKISSNDSLSEKDQKLTPTTYASWSQWLATKQPGTENNQVNYCETRKPIVVLDAKNHKEYSRFQIIMQHHIPICYHTSNDEHKHDDGDGDDGNSTNASSSCVEKGRLYQALARHKKHYGFSDKQFRMYVNRMFKIDKILTRCKRGDCANSRQYRVCWAILPTQQQQQEFRGLQSRSYFVSDYNNYDHYHLEQKVEQQQQQEQQNDFASPGGNDPQHHNDSRRRSRSIIIEKGIDHTTQSTSEKEKFVVNMASPSHCISFPPPFLVKNSMITCRLHVDPKLFVAHRPPMIVTQEMKNSKIFSSI